ncbi:hypothetical protein DPEC_G00150810 [Dallia pectoralis]|uniref:Uncharacterized protein n=1 Tax=Dallia pectoralis TaxID=75939 RepID=A0ACC2GJ90_DALPE|nr:hypothetical protein DPEC_G00150810 [Dallia pectoralis]
MRKVVYLAAACRRLERTAEERLNLKASLHFCGIAAATQRGKEAILFVHWEKEHTSRCVAVSELGHGYATEPDRPDGERFPVESAIDTGQSTVMLMNPKCYLHNDTSPWLYSTAVIQEGFQEDPSVSVRTSVPLLHLLLTGLLVSAGRHLINPQPPTGHFFPPCRSAPYCVPLSYWPGPHETPEERMILRTCSRPSPTPTQLLAVAELEPSNKIPEGKMGITMTKE